MRKTTTQHARLAKSLATLKRAEFIISFQFSIVMQKLGMKCAVLFIRPKRQHLAQPGHTAQAHQRLSTAPPPRGLSVRFSAVELH